MERESMSNDNIIFDSFSMSYTTKKEGGITLPWTLGPLSFNIGKGERVGIVGTSGSGKTSVLYALQHYHNPIRDDINYSGKLTKPNSVMMTVMQEPKAVLNPIRTVYRSFKLLNHSNFFEGKKALTIQEIKLFLEMVGLKTTPALLNARPSQLSGGMAQKVMIALGLALNPQWLLADEVSGSLDAVHEQQIMELLVTRIPSLLIVTHRIYLLKKYCTRVIFLSQGKSVFDGNVDAFFRCNIEEVQMFLDNLILTSNTKKES